MDVPGPSNLKRRRDDLDDTDDDTDDDDTDYEESNNDGFLDDESEPYRFGTSVLPVANLPASFDGIPQDGMEYLFTVR